MNVRTLLIAAGLAASTAAHASEIRQSIGVGVIDVFGVSITGSVVAPADPASTSKTNHEYNDGYNRLDSSGNLGEGAPGLPSRTSNFGFISDSQVDLKAGTIAWHTVTPAGSSYINQSSQHGSPGVEAKYEIVRERPDAWTFGLQARAGYVDVDYSSSDTLTTSTRLLTDTYQLGGVVPQPAPYLGSFTVQPGTQRIGDTPTRSISTVSATTQGSRDFSAKGWLLRLGAVWIPVQTRRVSLQFEGGAAALSLKGSFRLNERWVTSGQPAFTASTDGSRTKLLTGGYVGGTAQVALNDHWSIDLGADLLATGSMAVHSPGGSAKFDFGRTVVASGGISYRW